MTSKDVKKISIRLLPDGFSFLNQIITIQPGADYIKRLEDGLIEKLSELEEDLVIDHFSIENTRFCLSPLEINSDLARNMYKVGLPPYEGEETIITSEDVNHKIRFEFGIDSHLYHFILRNWPESRFSHPLFDLYLKWGDTENIKSDCMIAKAEDKDLNILIFKNGELHLANRFEDSGVNNIVYHVMNCWEQYGLDVLDDKLYLLTGNNELRNLLQQYIKQCES